MSLRSTQVVALSARHQPENVAFTPEVVDEVLQDAGEIAEKTGVSELNVARVLCCLYSWEVGR